MPTPTSTLRMTPLGTSPAFYNPGAATSGYLLETNGVRVLLDCGSGVVSRYLERFGSEKPLHAIVLTHVHEDHCADIVPLAFGIRAGASHLHGWRPELWLPPRGHDRLRKRLAAFDAEPDFLESAYAVHSYETGQAFEAASLNMEAVAVPHFIEAWALRVTSADSSLTYSGDCGMNDALVELAHGTDLLLCEATLPPSREPSPENAGHMTASEAGDVARRAEARRLLLTHVPVSLRTAVNLDRATKAYGAPAEFVSVGHSYSPVAHTSPAAR